MASAVCFSGPVIRPVTSYTELIVGNRQRENERRITGGSASVVIAESLLDAVEDETDSLIGAPPRVVAIHLR